MLNQVTIHGRMTQDAEIRKTADGVSVTSFTIACDKDFKAKGKDRETDFIPVVAWRGLAERVAASFHKGTAIIVSGRIQSTAWTDKDGNARRGMEVLAENIYFAERKGLVKASE